MGDLEKTEKLIHDVIDSLGPHPLFQ